MAIVLIERARHLNGGDGGLPGLDVDDWLLRNANCWVRRRLNRWKGDKELKLMVAVPGVESRMYPLRRAPKPYSCERMRAIATLLRKQANRTGSEHGASSFGNVRAYGVPA